MKPQSLRVSIVLAVCFCIAWTVLAFAQRIDSVFESGRQSVLTQEEPLLLGTVAAITLYGSDGELIKEFRTPQKTSVRILSGGGVTWLEKDGTRWTVIGTMIIESR